MYKWLWFKLLYNISLYLLYFKLFIFCLCSYLLFMKSFELVVLFYILLGTFKFLKTDIELKR